MKSFLQRAESIINRSCEAWADWRAIHQDEKDEILNDWWTVYELGKQEGLAQAQVPSDVTKSQEMQRDTPSQKVT